MARITVSGIAIDHDLIGPADAPVIVLTPGGRFARDAPGVPALAARLVEGGHRVLLWDRPNTGASDLCFEGAGESDMQARALVGLIEALGLGPVALAAGSAGSRVSLIAAAHAPHLVSHLVLWWISGGPLSLAQLASYYYADCAVAASASGMDAVAALPMWAEQLARNPAGRAIILRQDPAIFVETMQRWALAFAWSESSPVPGMTAGDFAKLTMPALIFRSSHSDISHTRRTGDWVAELLPDSTIADPPWGDQEWNRRLEGALTRGEPLFANWPLLAPDILAATRSARPWRTAG